MIDQDRIRAMVTSPLGVAYRGKVDCDDVRCTRRWKDGKMQPNCLGWHCLYCDERSDSQGGCSNREFPGQ